MLFPSKRACDGVEIYPASAKPHRLCSSSFPPLIHALLFSSRDLVTDCGVIGVGVVVCPCTELVVLPSSCICEWPGKPTDCSLKRNLFTGISTEYYFARLVGMKYKPKFWERSQTH